MRRDHLRLPPFRKFTYVVGGACSLLLLYAVSQNAYYAHMARIVGINLVVVFGVNVVMGFAGQATVGHAALFGLGAYASALLGVNYGWPPLASGLAAIAFTLIVGLLIAFNIIVTQLLMNLGGVTRGAVGVTDIPGLLPGSLSPHWELVVICAAAYFGYWMNKNIMKGFLVRELWAVRENEALAMCFGVNVFFAKIVAFEISALFAGLGGVLYAHTMGYISPDLSSFFVSVLFIMMLIAGGSGTLIGPIIGATVITALPELMHDFERYKISVFGLLLVFVALWFPKGIWGLAEEYRFQRRRATDGDSRGQRAPAPVVSFAESSAAARLRSAPFPSLQKPLLRVDSIEKHFGGVSALAGVSLEVHPGSVHAVIGPNGAGKSSLMNVISGLYASDEGEIFFAGDPITSWPAHRRARTGIVRIFQNLSLLEDNSVLDNVLLGLHPWWRESVASGLLWTPKRKRIETEKVSFCLEMLSGVGISNLASRRISELSYGQKKLVEVCRALVARPRLLLLDEPTSGLSQIEIGVFVEFLEDVKKTGVTTLLVEHHVDIVRDVSDYVTVLDFGKVIGSGTYEEIIRNPRVIEAYLGDSTTTDDARNWQVT
jgi:ABC-type branched-subunit amino acid transport system ATPase component/ABC-type branched-subunit amino acid transport system permease subunit